jgi:hypothetical protein
MILVLLIAALFAVSVNENSKPLTPKEQEEIDRLREHWRDRQRQ